ncbi:MAG: RNA-guided endonuclease InsQ/TnpB family protein [Desulfuromonadaceae bacterium]
MKKKKSNVAKNVKVTTFKYRIYPTKGQCRLLDNTLEECRQLYNHFLGKRKRAWEEEKKSLSKFDQDKTLPPLKERVAELKNIHSQVLQNVAERVDLAMQAFYRRANAGETPGYPRFKGFGRYDSITFPQVPNGCNLQNGKLFVSKIGQIKIVMHRRLEGTPKSAILSQTATGKWFVCFSCEVEPKRLPPKDNAVGIDVGLHTFAALSDGNKVENPKFFRSEEKELAKVQRKLSKAKKGTKERKVKRKAVARVYERISHKRDNFSHQESRMIVDGYGIICVEDLRVSRMVHNHCLSKSIHDAAWSGFFSMLSYKAEEAGRIFIKVNPAYTTQDCSRCHHRQKMPLSERVYTCPSCHLVIDRDLNSSISILRIGLDSLKKEAPVPLGRGE